MKGPFSPIGVHLTWIHKVATDSSTKLRSCDWLVYAPARIQSFLDLCVRLWCNRPSSAVTIGCRGALNHATALRPLSVHRLIPQRHGYAPQQTLWGLPSLAFLGQGQEVSTSSTTWQGRKELHQPAPQRGALWTELLKSGPPAWEAERDPRPVNSLSPEAFISSGETSITCPLPLDWLLLLIMPVYTHTHTHTWWYPAGVCPKWVAKTNDLKAIAAEYVCN